MSSSFVTSWTVAPQALLSMAFPGQESWSRLPFPPPRYLPNPGIKPLSPALRGGFFTTEPSGKPNRGLGQCLLSNMWPMSINSFFQKEAFHQDLCLETTFFMFLGVGWCALKGNSPLYSGQDGEQHSKKSCFHCSVMEAHGPLDFLPTQNVQWGPLIYVIDKATALELHSWLARAKNVQMWWMSPFMGEFKYSLYAK